MLDRPDRFHGSELLLAGGSPRFLLLDDKLVQWSQGVSTGRQAIGIRTWSAYAYMPEDYFNLRSIVTEASLATKGEYTVFLLMDMKREDGAKIQKDDGFYQGALKTCVPPEFRSIAVLFHQSLQESWYAKTDKFHPNFQIMQPFQLFAHFYSEFDHYWQFEMDNRFTGNVAEMLWKFHTFGSQELYQTGPRASIMDVYASSSRYLRRVFGES